MASAIDTAAKRARLSPRKNPYWQGVSGGRGGVSLGFRTAAKGPGCWIAKIVVDGRRLEERIGFAEGHETPGAISFPSATTAALQWGKRQVAAIEAGQVADVAAKVPTVRLAVEEYAASRKDRAGRAGSEGALKLHVLSDGALPGVKLAKLNAQDIEGWRARLRASLKPSTKNRMLNDLRSALYAAAVKHRRTIPAHIPAEIKVGTKAESGEGSPRRQLLSDVQIRAVVNAAFEVDPDFGQLVLIAAATGARFSQEAGLIVSDLQVKNARVMMPSSRKGKNWQPGAKVAVPLERSVIERLTFDLSGRPLDEPLLQRWWHKKAGGPGKWVQDRRGAWKHAYEVEPFWTKVVELASLPPGTVMYSLRHSSIVRGLRAGLPVRLVAALHDTSIEMIEKHYAAFIVDMTEDMARASMMSFEAATGGMLQAVEMSAEPAR
jgi:hypothetical protein